MKFNLLVLIIMMSIGQSNGQNFMRLADINPGTGNSAAFNDNSTIYYNGILFFSANDGIHGDELWIYENSEVTLLKDINEGEAGSEIQNMYVLNDKLIFTANTSAHGTEWWTSDGTSEGTQLLIDINSGNSNGVYANYFYAADGFGIYNEELYFTGIVDADYELWKTDGTNSGTVLVKNIASFGSSFPNSYVVFNEELYFSCHEGLWKTNGTTGGTILVEDEDPEDAFGFEPRNLFATNEYMLMIQDDNLWVSDGTSSGTNKIYDFEYVSLNWGGPRFRLVNGIVLFPADDGNTGDELWKTDGSTAGTQLVKDVWNGTDGYAPQNTVVFQDKLYYKGNDGESDIELFVSDGTELGTHLFFEFSENGSGFSLPTEIVADENNIYMNAGVSFSKELWVSDGLTNTFEIDINPSGESIPNSFYLFDEKLFCFARTGDSGFEPYIVDLNATVIDEDEDGYSVEDDCDDSNPEVNPGQEEIPYNGLDDDCNSSTLDDDLDQDGFLLVDDCDDSNPNINPDVEEIPDNGIDEDCDGMDLVTSIQKLSKSTINIFPNPVTDRINIIIEGQLNFKSSIYSLTGELMVTTTNITQINVNALATGIYLLEIQDLNTGERIVEKIIKTN